MRLIARCTQPARWRQRSAGLLGMAIVLSAAGVVFTDGAADAAAGAQTEPQRLAHGDWRAAPAPQLAVPPELRTTKSPGARLGGRVLAEHQAVVPPPPSGTAAVRQ